MNLLQKLNANSITIFNKKLRFGLSNRTEWPFSFNGLLIHLEAIQKREI